jgi:hypothetical protein
MSDLQTSETDAMRHFLDVHGWCTGGWNTDEDEPVRTVLSVVRRLENELYDTQSQLESAQQHIATGRSWNSPDSLLAENEQLKGKLNEAQTIIASSLSALPVGYIPAHTPESIPDRITDLCKTIVDLERELCEVRAYADKLADGLPEGMLPKDIEVMRDANAVLAQERFDARGHAEQMAAAILRFKDGTCGLAYLVDLAKETLATYQIK